MDDQVQKQLVKQLKILNFWITFFGSIFIIIAVILGILLYQAITFTRNAVAKIEDMQQKTEETLDVRHRLCTDNSVTSFLQRNSDICKPSE